MIGSSGLSDLVFDLDDTLLDTFGQLIPPATREACNAMVEAGLRANLDEALSECRERQLRSPRIDLFAMLVDRFGVEPGCDPQEVAKCGGEAFYNRRVEETISVFPGAREMLVWLRDAGYRLHLVTQGHRPTQEAKIRILGLQDKFDSILHVDPSRGERKRQAFERIQSQASKPAVCFMSIGNRIDTDISEAKVLGWRTCWLKHGEYRELEPSSPTEQPDYTIERLADLRSACRL